MALIATTISDTTVHMRYADDPDSEKAKGWMEKISLHPIRFVH